MSQQWFRIVNGETVGPCTSQTLLEMAKAGELQAQDMVSDDEAKTWIPAGRIQGLVFVASGSRCDLVSSKLPIVAAVSTQPTAVQLIPAQAATEISFDEMLAALPSLPNPNTHPTLVVATPATPVPVGQVSRSVSKTVIGLAIVLSSLVFAGIGLGAGYLMNRGQHPTGGDLRGDAIEKELKESRDKLRKDIETLEKDQKSKIEALDSERKAIERATDQLKEHRDELSQEIQDLTTKLDFVKKWQTANLVLMDSDKLAIALQKTGSSFTVLQKAEGEMAELAIANSRSRHIPRVADNVELVHDISSQVQPGNVVPVELFDRMRRDWWKPHEYVEIEPTKPTESLDMVVYREAVTNRTQIGYLHEASEKGIVCEVPGASREWVPWEKIQPGSARRGSPQAVLPMLGNVDYLEYVLLRVAQKLGTGGVSKLRPRVLVHVEIDTPDDHMEFWKDVDQQLSKLDSSPPPMIYAPGEGYLASIAAIYNMGTQLTYKDPVTRRIEFHEKMVRTDPHRRIRNLTSYVEDEVVSWLSGWGIPTVGQKDLTILAEQSIDRAAAMQDASHLLWIGIKDPLKSGDYHLSARLIHESSDPSNSALDIWATEGDRAFSEEAQLPMYHCSSGELAILTVHAGGEEQFDAIESPPLVDGVKRRTSVEERSELVYLEPPSDDSMTRYRRVFDPNVRQISSKLIEMVRRVDDLNLAQKANSFPQEHLLRYVAVRLTKSLLTPVGRVSRVSSEQAKVLGLDQIQGIQPGDRLRVCRLAQGQDSLSILPTEVALADLGVESHVTFSATGFESLASENVTLREGDILFPKSQIYKSVEVEQLSISQVPEKIRGALYFRNNRAIEAKYLQMAVDTEAKLRGNIAGSLARIGIPTENSGGGQTTHRVHGTITLSPRMNIEGKAAARPKYTVSLRLSERATGDEVDLIEFDMDDFLLPYTRTN